MEIILVVAITMLPFLELRASIPYAIFGLGMHWLAAMLVCITANALLGIIVFVLINKIVGVLLKVDALNRFYNRKVERTQEKIKRYVDRYGLLGVSLFIGIPLPGTGSWTGALGSWLLGIKFRKFAVANFIGVAIAGAIVTAVCVAGGGAFNIFIK
ncbi:MAG: small multi-drug export protein [Candidatus Nanoarchaeia archaeon]